MVIAGEAEDENQANELLKNWMKDPENREFVAKHNYQNKWEAGNDENGNPAILAYFKNAPEPMNDISNSQKVYMGGPRADYMRSTAFTTGPPPGTFIPEGQNPMWQSYHAQERERSRERELSANAEHYRRMRHEHQNFMMNQEMDRRGSPVRSRSPVRHVLVTSPPPQMLPPPDHTRYAPAFSHYEQHREQRE